MNYLILGGNGYLGSRVISKLLCTDDNARIVVTARSMSNLRFAEEERVSYISTLNEEIASSMDENDFDIVLNFSCCYGRDNLLENNICEANIIFPLYVLNLAVEKNIKKFMTIDTALPDRLNMYTFTKTVFREFGKFYCDNHNLDFYNLELQMFYASDEPLDRFIPQAVADMINGKQVLTTVGTQKRDIISVDDVVEGIICVINSGLKGYNSIPIGTSIAPAVSELIDFIREETGNKSEVIKGAVPMREYEPDCIADISAISKLCKWEPVYWKDGIRKMIAEMTERLTGNK